jgi:integrase
MEAVLVSKEMRGSGTVSLRGNVWHIQYCVGGQVFRESNKSSIRNDAVKLLKRRLKDAEPGKVSERDAEKVTMKDMVEALMANYDFKENRSTSDAQRNTNTLVNFFGERQLAITITKERIDVYIAQRKAADMSNASINRELAALHRMFALMVKSKRLSHDHIPDIDFLPEADARQGFLERPEFEQLVAVLPPYLQDPITFLYLSGWRKGAMQSLEWSDIEPQVEDGVLVGGTVNLRPAKSKNKRPFQLRLKGDLLELFQRLWARRIPESPWVFHYRGGQPIGDFKKVWHRAVAEIGLPTLLVHDLRRSAARNLMRAGVSQTVIMKRCGWLTADMFRRYNITSESDLEDAEELLSAFNRKKSGEQPKIVPLSSPDKASREGSKASNTVSKLRQKSEQTRPNPDKRSA